MILFITGTPGTGKSTVSGLLKEQLSIPLIDLNQLVEDEGFYTGYHPEWGFKIVDLDALCHYCEGADLVIVLRAHPAILRKRLEDKGFNDAKIQENIEAEALDICAFEAFQIHGDKANEIDTSHKNPQEVVDLIKKVINGEKYFPVGKVDFLDYLHPQ
jgi:adenylate kinase